MSPMPTHLAEEQSDPWSANYDTTQSNNSQTQDFPQIHQHNPYSYAFNNIFQMPPRPSTPQFQHIIEEQSMPFTPAFATPTLPFLSSSSSQQMPPHPASTQSATPIRKSPPKSGSLRSIKNPMIAKESNSSNRATPAQIMSMNSQAALPEAVGTRSISNPALQTSINSSIPRNNSLQSEISSPFMNFSPPGFLQTPSSLVPTSASGTGDSVFGQAATLYENTGNTFSSMLEQTLFSPMNVMPDSNIHNNQGAIHDQFSGLNFSPMPFGMGASITTSNQLSSSATPIISSQPSNTSSGAKRLTPMEVMNHTSSPLHPSPLQPVAIKRKLTTSNPASPVESHLADNAERRKAYRKEAEKQRRNQLKSGFDAIKDLIPTADKSASKEKLLELGNIYSMSTSLINSESMFFSL
ncbi:hypothetical protein BDR26DRAFT_854145 [Obelidium mucronatum]|nr:hypothetical protein BDR26DRAFT_854145 [Obelidium mucronatum]